MKAICAGTRSQHDVVHESLEKYREVFYTSLQQMDVLKGVSCRVVLGCPTLANLVGRAVGQEVHSRRSRMKRYIL